MPRCTLSAVMQAGRCRFSAALQSAEQRWLVLSRVNHSHPPSADKVIYIIDPDASEKHRLEEVLTSAFGHVETFDDTQSFLTQCESTQQGCLIVSARVTGMSVLGLIDRLKCERKHLPVIVLGEQTDMRLSVDVMRAGAADFVAKPFTQRRLRQAVRKAIT